MKRYREFSAPASSRVANSRSASRIARIASAGPWCEAAQGGRLVKLDVDIQRCSAELDRLAQFSDVPAPAVKRVVFTEADLSARQYLIGLFEDAGLKVRMDAVGNIFARWQGSDASLPPVAT